ncbi:hypothetical protein K9M78_06135 [Candidatus Bipolaricaulota bacterium]|nr:hypothetical protein [Candidatus Bipolaricaulota bacterium]
MPGRARRQVWTGQRCTTKVKELSSLSTLKVLPNELAEDVSKFGQPAGNT